jgi:hypothetical protein
MSMSNLNKYHMYFFKGKYDIPYQCNSKRRGHKGRFKKNRIVVNDYDKLFFNFLNIIRHPRLDNFYNINVEREIKLEMATHLENMKIPKKDDVITQLCYDKCISLQVLKHLCRIYDICMTYHHEKVFCNLFNVESKGSILQSDNVCFLLRKDLSIHPICKDKLLHIWNTNFEIEYVDKFLRAQSYYKKEDLIKMYNQLYGTSSNMHDECIANSSGNEKIEGNNVKTTLSIPQKMKKQELYDCIFTYLQNSLTIIKN